MKKFIHDIGELKFITALYFMAAIMLGSIGSYFHGVRAFSFVTIWQLLGMSMVFGGLHYIQMSKLSIMVRILLHSILSYITVVLFSVFCKWGFIESVSVFWQFTAIFVGVYILIFLAFAFYYKNEDVYLNKKLDEYKEINKQ
jgi:hypothetical protein